MRASFQPRLLCALREQRRLTGHPSYTGDWSMTGAALPH
jgi:hypothetical protein